MKGENNNPSPEPEIANIQDEQLSSNQQSVPAPMVWGTRKIAVKWISRVYNQFTKEAPVSRPGKK